LSQQQNPFCFDRSDIAISFLNETLRGQLEHTLTAFAADAAGDPLGDPGLDREDRIAQQAVDAKYHI
jgi:hypothetical protein